MIHSVIKKKRGCGERERIVGMIEGSGKNLEYDECNFNEIVERGNRPLVTVVSLSGLAST